MNQAIKGGIREKVQLATKFGLKSVDGKIIVQGDPAYVRAACEASLKRLDVDYIDLYYQHRVDTRVPIEVTVSVLSINNSRIYFKFSIEVSNASIVFLLSNVQMGELKKLVEEGKIKYVGLSEACAATIRRAHAIHPITAVQMEWSLWTRDLEQEIVPTCRYACSRNSVRVYNIS